MKVGKDGRPEDLLKGEQTVTAQEESRKENERPGSKLEQFWYYYKWHTITAIALIPIIVIAVLQLFGNTSPDAYIMYVGPSAIDVKSKDEMAATAAEDVYDQNGDGRNYVAFLEITVVSGDDIPYTAYETNVDANKRFLTELASGDSVVYLLDESFFARAADEGLLCPLAEIIDPALLPENMYDECAVRVSELDYFKREGFDSVPGDTLLCIRRSPDKDAISYGRTQEYWDCNKALVQKMFAYKLPEPVEKAVKAFDNGKNDIVIGVYDSARHYSTDGAKLAYAASSILKDVNSDGKTLLAVDPVLTGGKNAAEYFASQMADGKEVIFMANAEYYAKLVESGALRPIAEVIGTNAEKLGCADGYGLRIGDLKWFAETPYFKKFDGDLYICITQPRDGDEKSAFYRGNVDFFVSMVTYKLDLTP